MRRLLRHLPNIILFSTRAFIGIALFLIGYATFKRLFRNVFDDGFSFVGLSIFWAYAAYFFLPKIHRFLSKIYLPDYFIGRVRTGDGLLGDPVNLAINGTKKQLIVIMQQAGWHIAEDLSVHSTLKMIKSSILKQSYPTAPVSSLFLFQKKQDIAFQIEVAGNPHARHHVRFWKTPRQWWLPGGLKADWLGAATYDKRVGFSLFTGQFTHKIEERVDIERDFTVSSMTNANRSVKAERIEHFMTAFRSRNGGGDRIQTDGALQIVDLTKIA